MKIIVKPGSYLLAVSGGVDSVVLLDLLAAELPKSGLSVAHFDHGIRGDSAGDRKFVQKLAKNYGLRFFYEEGKLGAKASEALARSKRYEFLNKVKKQTDSEGIITAHHQDDAIETMVINVLRGTGRKGLSSLSSRPGVLRPLLDFSKADLLGYAKENNLVWQEDETNKDQKYLRNYVRHSLLANLSEKQRQDLLKIARDSKILNKKIDGLVENLFRPRNGISRELFVSLNHNVASEVIAGWLRNEKVRLDKKTIDRLVVKLKVSQEGKIIQASQNKYFIVRKNIIRMNTPGPV